MDVKARNNNSGDNDVGEALSVPNKPIGVYFEYGSSQFDLNLSIAKDPTSNQLKINKAIARLNSNSEMVATGTGNCSVPQLTTINPIQVVNSVGQSSLGASGDNAADRNAGITFNIQRTNQG